VDNDTGLTFTVVIPVYNDNAGLSRCLDALARQTYSKERFEVVVVDNGSDVPIDAVAPETLNVRFLSESTPGSYAARNHGAGNADGRFLAFTDADCIPAHDWLEAADSLLERSSHEAVVGGAVEMFIPEDQERNATALYDLIVGLRQEKYLREQGFLITANLIVPVSIFNKVGTFRQDLFSGGDVEWCRRVASRKISMEFSSVMVVYHPVRSSMRDLRKKVLRVTQGAVSSAYPGEVRRRGGVLGRLRSLFRVARAVWVSDRLRGVRERLKVYLIACLVVAWTIEAKARFHLFGERTR